MFNYLTRIAVVLAAICLPAHGATWHVKKGATGDGRSPEESFGTIQQAAEIARPGDTVIIYPGVYFEHVQVRAKGTSKMPITFKADKIEKNRVILTGADQPVRNKEVHWVLEDKALGLYSAPWDRPRPTRVLYSGTDLYPYLDLEHLKQFMAVMLPDRRHWGPQHGFALDPEKKRIYVRLHASGRYGSSDPNDHIMSISPPTGEDENLGLQVSSPTHYNFGVLGAGDANIVVQGLTFETPGIAGVYTEANNVTVSDCWFIGCRGGVEGTAPYFSPGSISYERLANRVIVEYCHFTQFPTYEDGCETIRLALQNPPKQEEGKPPIKNEVTFWARKDVNGGLPDAKVNYEVGIVVLAGQDWVVRHNHVDDAFEALSSRSTTSSDNLHVYENVFEKLLDNAVEAEDHSTNLHVYRNLIRDTFGPLSWQPLQGEPWPGPTYWYQNVIYNSPEHAARFLFRVPCVFKIGATGAAKQYGKGYVPKVSEPGIVIFNNTVVSDSVMFWAALWGNNPDKVKVYNNIFIMSMGFPARIIKEMPSYLESGNNLCAPFPGSTIPYAGRIGGDLFENYAEIGLKDPLRGMVSPTDGSPALNKSVAVPGVSESINLRDIGAVQRGDDWYPPQVGPRTTP